MVTAAIAGELVGFAATDENVGGRTTHRIIDAGHIVDADNLVSDESTVGCPVAGYRLSEHRLRCAIEIDEDARSQVRVVDGVDGSGRIDTDHEGMLGGRVVIRIRRVIGEGQIDVIGSADRRRVIERLQQVEGVAAGSEIRQQYVEDHKIGVGRTRRNGPADIAHEIRANECKLYLRAVRSQVGQGACGTRYGYVVSSDRLCERQRTIVISGIRIGVIAAPGNGERHIAKRLDAVFEYRLDGGSRPDSRHTIGDIDLERLVDKVSVTVIDTGDEIEREAIAAGRMIEVLMESDDKAARMDHGYDKDRIVDRIAILEGNELLINAVGGQYGIVQSNAIRGQASIDDRIAVYVCANSDVVIFVCPNLHIQTVEVEGNRRQSNLGHIARTGRPGNDRAIVDDIDLEVVLD
ncbi:hypothetical protein, partial [Neorhizobium vignae]|uniref:hypothetical protein n=1 Tax=Neorhizobium vignae TaxID=690585 RepID=UPI001267BF13